LHLFRFSSLRTAFYSAVFVFKIHLPYIERLSKLFTEFWIFLLLVKELSKKSSSPNHKILCVHDYADNQAQASQSREEEIDPILTIIIKILNLKEDLHKSGRIDLRKSQNWNKITSHIKSKFPNYKRPDNRDKPSWYQNDYNASN